MRRPDLSALRAGIPLKVILATYGIGGAGAMAGYFAGLPLGILLGAMVAVAGSAAFGPWLFGHQPSVPQKWRFVLVPVIGVAIGAGFPADFLDQATRWWATLLALVVFVPTTHALGFWIYRRSGIDKQTAYFAAMPGGFIESLEMGDKANADMVMLVMLQFLRLILCIVFVPILFALFSGHAVGSSAGLSLSANHDPLRALDVVVLIALGVGGWWIANLLKFPAAILSGPLLLSAVAHAAGMTTAVPPGWAVLVTQWIVGASLGARLAGFQRAKAFLAIRLAVVNVASMMAIACVIAFALSRPVDEPIGAVILAFAPGGVSEMALVALSLHMSAVYVTLHHLLRIILAVFVSRLGLRLLERAH